MPANADAPVAGFLKTLPEWSNSDRRSFLFAEFPHERTPENSTSYDSALAFWTRTVTEATRQRLLLEQAAAGAGEATTAAAATGHGPSGSAVALGTYGLQHVFGHESGAVPLGLDTVLGHMHATGTLVRLQDFLAATDTASSSSSGSITVSTAASTAVATVGWMLNALVATPVRWTVAQVIGSSSKGLTERHETMVVKPLVQAAADAILAHLTSSMLYSTDLLIDEQGFQDLCKESNALGTGAQAVSALDVQILLHHFKQQNWAVFESATSSEDQSSRTTIKFRKPAGASAQRQTSKSGVSASAVADGPRLAISKADRGIVTIKATIRKLTAQVSEMEAKMLSLTEQARQAAASKLKHRALNALRQRKNLEQSCNQRAASLETLDMVLHKIQSAESDSEILTAYEAGTSTLRTFLKQHNLTAERADAVMDDVQDVLADASDIERAFTDGQTAILEAQGVEMDDSEMLRELDRLVEEEKVRDVETKLSGLSVSAAPLPSVVASASADAGVTQQSGGDAESTAKSGKSGKSGKPALEAALA